jgi:hypothetical protein
MNFLRWCSSSIAGHLVLVGLPFFAAEMIVGLLSNYYEGALTASWAVHIASVCAAGAFAVALLVWYTITRPLLKRKKGT